MAAELRDNESNEASSASAMERTCRTPSYARINVIPDRNSFVADDISLPGRLMRGQIRYTDRRGAASAPDRLIPKSDSLLMSIFRIDTPNPFH